MAEYALYVKVEGAERIQEALKDPKLLKGPIADFLKKSMFYVELAAKEKAPVDTGRLKASISPGHPETMTEVKETHAVIGTKVFYAPMLEFGTKPHFPPPSALAVWARRHGMPGAEFAIARAIAKRGTRPRPFLVPALTGAKSAIEGFLREAADKIEAYWGKK